MHNPYAPPMVAQAASNPRHKSGDDVLASLGARLGAVVIDELLVLPAIAPGATFYLSVDDKGLENVLYGLALVALGFLALVLYQSYLISHQGQTIGKNLFQIKIVRVDGSRLTFYRGVILRSWGTPSILIPFFGFIYQFIDCLMILGSERRCLHDRLAGTKVVDAAPTL